MPFLFLDPATPTHWPTAQTPYQADALTFCRAWLSVQSEFLLHTSGSTGLPQPIRLTRVQMRASAHLTGQTLGLQPGDAALVCLNIRYVAGVMMLVRGLELGLPMTIIEPSGNPLADFDPAADSFVFAAFVPLQLQTMLEQATDKLLLLNRMKAILVGGAATSPVLEEALQAIESPVFSTYGMTETVSHVALRRLNGPQRASYFTALDGVALGIDSRSCLHITAAATNFVRVQTNDVVQLLPLVATEKVDTADRFRLLGRADRIINSGGMKIQPEQLEQIIENVLTPIGLSARLFVAGLPDERLGQRIVLFIENHTLRQDIWAAIQDAIKQQTGPYAVPKEVFTIGQFTETPTGKIDRARTIDRYR